ncbi:SDR family NAD(P)-dependent oxidoreductase [Bosea sp. 2YAB26]|uniref:SDR family NAD(P)-dependent oxidoreductase n=1 Tax=Bosea sp. 2YAB26 TaxID=3237478 RepID=UPI003F91C298
MTASHPLDIFSLKGHHALVTGGGSGLGLGIARCFAAAGARVTLAGTNAQKIEKAAADLGGETGSLPFDVTRVDEAEAYAEAVSQRFGPVSILVNNAGNTIKNPIAKMTPTDFRTILDVHVHGAYALSRAFLAQIEQAGNGSILFTASMSSFLGIPNVIGYSAAKAAYVGMVRAMATELAPQKVRVNGVAPGWIDTPLFRQATSTDPDRKAKIDGRIPMKSYGTEADIGWAMTYLASAAAAYVTGHIVVVDGGALHGF